MGYDGRDELNEELEKIEKMSPYDRLCYIYNIVEFYAQIGEYNEESFKALRERIRLVTKGYTGR
jgi:hypothetical protein